MTNTAEQIAADARVALAFGQRITIVQPKPWRDKPKGWPRGELIKRAGQSGGVQLRSAKILGLPGATAWWSRKSASWRDCD